MTEVPLQWRLAVIRVLRIIDAIISSCRAGDSDCHIASAGTQPTHDGWTARLAQTISQIRRIDGSLQGRTTACVSPPRTTCMLADTFESKSKLSNTWQNRLNSTIHALLGENFSEMPLFTISKPVNAFVLRSGHVRSEVCGERSTRAQTGRALHCLQEITRPFGYRIARQHSCQKIFWPGLGEWSTL